MTSAHNTTPLVQSVTVFPTSKVCTVCHTDKPLSEFSPNSIGKYGKQAQCKPCRSSAELRRRALSPEKHHQRTTIDQIHKAVFHGMKQRCCNPAHDAYKNYGGRGITVCARWTNSYDNFIADMGYRPADGYQIDRIDNDGSYEPSNCRWVTRSENCINRRPCTEARPPRGASHLGLSGVRATSKGRYRVVNKRLGREQSKTFDSFIDACAYRLSFQNKIIRGEI